jgi:putative transposase
MATSAAGVRRAGGSGCTTSSDGRCGSRSGERLSRAPGVWIASRCRLQRGGPRGFDGGKHVKGRKRHVLVDTLGLLWAVLVTPANVQDKTGLRWLLEEWGPFLRRLRMLWADGAYLSESLAAWLLGHFGWQLVITHPPLPTRGFAVAPKRWMVERTFAWLVHHRRLRVDYEATIPASTALIHVAMLHLTLRRLARLSR